MHPTSPSSAKIVLSNGMEVLVDSDDEQNLRANVWHLAQSAKDGTGYATRWTRKDGKFSAIRMHRVIMGLPNKWNGLDVDHINGNKLDNRKNNLRICTRGQNRHYHTRLAGLGATFHKATNKWRARIMFKGVGHHLGLFDTQEGALAAYRLKANELYWEGKNE